MSAPQCEPNNGLWKGMIVCSFIMLSMLTWAMSPLQKLVEKVQHKETIKAKMFVCSEVRAMMPVYADWTSRLFASGCIWQMRNIYLAMLPEKEDQIREEFKAQEGKLFEDTLNGCNEGAAANQRENKITERVVVPLYMEKMDCPAVYEEAEKLGIKEEDLNNG